MQKRSFRRNTIALTLGVACATASGAAAAQVVNWRRAALRYTSAGDYDSSFNNSIFDGGPGRLVQSAPGATGTGFFDVALSGSSYVTAGYQDTTFLVERLTSAGRPDFFFGGGDGVVTTDFASIPRVIQSQALAVATDSSNGIVAVGFVVQDGLLKVAVARYLSDGNLDNRFSNDGLLVDGDQIVIGQHTIATAVRVLSDGKILLVGYTSNNLGFVIRYTSAGQRDTTFGDIDRGTMNGLGWLRLPAGATAPAVHDMAIDSSGRILGGGTALVSGQNGFACWRRTALGVADTNFSSDGFAFFWPGKTAQGLSIAADGAKPLLVGEAGLAGARKVGLLRLTSTGALDSTFDQDGYKEHDIAESADEGGWEVAIQSSNRPVVTGFSGDRVFLARYSSSGAVETLRRTDVVTNSPAEGATALAIDGSGRFVVAGWVGPAQ